MITRCPFKLFSSPCLCVVVVICFVQAAAAAEPEWTPLFDGRTLDGWTRRGGDATYRVEDGALIGTAVGGSANTFLCTDRSYADFVLEYEFRVHPRLNSGVQIRSNSFPGYQGGRVHGYQVEIDPSERAFTGGIYDEARRGWLADLKDNEAARKAFQPGEWNQVRVEARGPRIRTWLNNVAAADLTDDLTHTGFIALQVHAVDEATLKAADAPLEVRWRNLRIRDLGDPWLAPPPAGRWLLRDAADRDHWHPVGAPGTPIAWKWQTDPASTTAYLEVEPGAGSIATRDAFGDCRLHLEFAVDDSGKTGQANGNSGVYLQRRYEIQILNSAPRPPAENECGAIYRVRAPDYALARPAGEWQTYDIWFRAARWGPDGKKTDNARLTVYHNDTRVHREVDITGPTGAGQAERPDDGPLLLQEHGHRVRFRNVWIAPLQSHP